MKTPADQKTGDLLPECDLAGERPAKPTQREQGAKRVAKYREKNDVTPMTVNIDSALKREFDAFLAARPHLRRSDVVAKAIRTQVLRKR